MPLEFQRGRLMQQQALCGRCLCGKVSYEYSGQIEEIAMCHCSQCRKAQGGLFATNSPIDSNRLNFTGIEHIREYQSGADKIRAFCGNCGSPLYSALRSKPNIKRLRLGTLDTEIHCSNRYHIFTASSANWEEISDDYPQYKERAKANPQKA